MKKDITIMSKSISASRLHTQTLIFGVPVDKDVLSNVKVSNLSLTLTRSDLT